MQRILTLSSLAATGLLLSACASLGTPVGLQAGQTVAVVNSLSWDNPLTGKRDGVRTSWPIKNGKIAPEYFPLAQLKQCEAGGKPCAWGVMRAQRGAPTLSYADGGVDLAVNVSIDVARRQDARQGETQTAMAIPAGCGRADWAATGAAQLEIEVRKGRAGRARLRRALPGVRAALRCGRQGHRHVRDSVYLRKHAAWAACGGFATIHVAACVGV